MADIDEFSYRDRCAISGIGTTEFSRNSGRSVRSLAVEASLRAIEDAGLRPSDIDGIVRADTDQVRQVDLADALGLPDLRYYGDVGVGGVAPCGMIGQAIGALLTGQAKHVLAFRSLNGRSGHRYGQPSRQAERSGGGGTFDEFFTPYGLQTVGHASALIAQRHMYEYGTTEKDLGAVATTIRARANANPAAIMYERPMTMDDYLASKMISSPLRLYDYCLESDGACAVVISTVDRAKDGPHKPVLVSGVAYGGGHDLQPGTRFSALLRSSVTELPARYMAPRLFDAAGMGPLDIDVAQLYDNFTIIVLMQLEAFGFCKTGEGGPFASSGAIDIGGTLPINTSGGQLSEGYVHGMSLILEGVRQLRGVSTSQVDSAETCLVASTTHLPGTAMILRKS